MSTQSIGVLTLTGTAAAAILAHQAVDFDGNVATAALDIWGFAETDAAAGRDFAVRTLGTATAIAGGPITKGDAVEVAAGGKLVVKAAGIGVAVALEDAAADGTEFEVLIRHGA